MADSTGSIGLSDLLTCLLSEHAPKEEAFHRAQDDYTKDSKFIGDEVEGDPPVWETTAWDVAVRWLAQRSKFFHSIDPARCIDETPIKTYERLLRHYLTDVKYGGPTRSNQAAAELVEFERQSLAAELCEELGAILPTDVEAQLAAASPTGAKPKRRGPKKADYATQKREAELAADWKRARDAGTCKRDFAREHEMTVKKLDTLLNRVAKRKHALE